MKKILTALCAGLISLSLGGCLAVVAGAGGTALWQAGKVVTEENASMLHAANAVESVFKAKKITLNDKVTKNESTQLRGEDAAGKKVSVDVLSKGPNNVRIEVRYGLNEEASARELVTAIKRRL